MRSFGFISIGRSSRIGRQGSTMPKLPAAHDSNSVASTRSKKNIATRSEFGSLTTSGAI
jgi:hypothetical protein